MKTIITTHTVGVHFGTIGVLWSVRADGRRGTRRLGETVTYPYQCHAAAREQLSFFTWLDGGFR